MGEHDHDLTLLIEEDALTYHMGVWLVGKRGMEILGSVAANSKHPKTRHAQSIHLSVRRAEESSKMLQKDMEKGEAPTLDKPEVFKFPTTISPSHKNRSLSQP